MMSVEPSEEALLSTFCVGDFAGLIVIFGGLRVKHLLGYTEEKLMALVERWCDDAGKGDALHQLVPPFLASPFHAVLVDGQRHVLASFFLAQAATEPQQKRHKATGDETFFDALWKCQIVPFHWNSNENDPAGDPHLRYVTLPQFSWLTAESETLFVRSCYKPLWNLINAKYVEWREGTSKERMQRVLLLGTTGIGESVSLNFFMLMTVRAGYPVLFETRILRYWLHDGTVESELLVRTELLGHRADRNVFFLVDHEEGKPPPHADAFTVAAMSPDARGHKEFRKTRCVELWMPMTMPSELIALNELEFKLPADELQSRLSVHGPSVRLVFLIQTGRWWREA